MKLLKTLGSLYLELADCYMESNRRTLGPISSASYCCGRERSSEPMSMLMPNEKILSRKGMLRL